jgi:hypothetical protein
VSHRLISPTALTTARILPEGEKSRLETCPVSSARKAAYFSSIRRLVKNGNTGENFNWTPENPQRAVIQTSPIFIRTDFGNFIRTFSQASRPTKFYTDCRSGFLRLQISDFRPQMDSIRLYLHLTQVFVAEITPMSPHRFHPDFLTQLRIIISHAEAGDIHPPRPTPPQLRSI